MTIIPTLILLVLLANEGASVRRLDSTFSKRDARRSLEAERLEAEGFRRLKERGLAADATSPDEHLVKQLPGLADDAFPTRQWAGLLTVDEAIEGKYFYWFVEAASDAANKPLLIWLNGGPGCSSMDGFFLEHGPFKVLDDMSLSVHPYSWHHVANVVYVDQPVGTGFSFTGRRQYCDDDDCINKHMYSFLQAFAKLHKDLVLPTGTEIKTKPIFFSGESQAGHYIPSMVDYIMQQNPKAASPEVVLDVQGMAIGNGWFDPLNQYDVSDYAHGAGLISEGQYHTLQKKRQECNSLLAQGKYYTPICFALLDLVVGSTGTDQTGFVSFYDYRKYDHPGDRVFPPGHRTAEQYMNLPQVKEALHAGESPLRFQECTDPPYDALKHQDGLGVTEQVGRILEGGVRALFFNGAFDVICNHMGNEAALQALKWSGQDAFHEARRAVWIPEGGGAAGEGKPGGFAKSSGALTYLVVAGAGHMVPLDVPAAALDMMTRFVNLKSFDDKLQGIEMTVVPEDTVAASSATALNGAGETPTAPQTPTLRKVTASETESGVVVFDVEGVDGQEQAVQSEELWYTVLVNPGGSILVPRQSDAGEEDADVAQPGPLLLTDLKEGVDYTFQVLANNVVGASKPSEPARLVLGCGGPSGAGGPNVTTCEHGLCGLDAVMDEKRCFCYAGWGGSGCQVAGPVVSDSTAAKGGNKKQDSGAKEGVGNGRVTFVVDQSCTDAQVSEECALRFTVPLHLNAHASSEDKEGGGKSSEWSVLDGPEETNAFEGMLRRDLAQILDVRKEQVELRALHPLKATAHQLPGASGGSRLLEDTATATPPAETPSEEKGGPAPGVEGPMALTFDVLHPLDPSGTVKRFTSVWAMPQGPLSFGLVTSNFDVNRNAEVLLLAQGTPLPGLLDSSSSPDVILEKKTKRTATLSFAVILFLGAVVLMIVRYSRRKLGFGPGGTGSGAQQRRRQEMQGGGGRRRMDSPEDQDLDHDIVLDGSGDDGTVVEIMEMRMPTGSQGSRGGSGLGGSGSILSRIVPDKDGADERLV